MSTTTPTSYLFTPAYICSDLFWLALGYDTNRTLAVLQAIRSKRIGDTNHDFDNDKAVTLFHPIMPALRRDRRKERDEEEEIQMTVFNVFSAPPLPTLKDSDSATSPAQESISDEGDVSTTITYTSRTQESSLSTSFRPPSTILSLFQRRISARLSSFEFLPDITSQPHCSSPSSPEAQYSQVCEAEHGTEVERDDETPDNKTGMQMREPTQKEFENVENAIAEEVKQVEDCLSRFMLSRRCTSESDDQVKDCREHSVEASASAREQQTYNAVGFFRSLSPSFADISIKREGIDTLQFLSAVEALTEAFGEFLNPILVISFWGEYVLTEVEGKAERFESVAFQLVQSAINDDISKIKTRYDAHEEESRTLTMLMLEESKERKRPAQESVLWLIRGLRFFTDALKSSLESMRIDPAGTGEELAESFTKAWEFGYSRYFHWALRPLFKVVIKACPSRSEFYSKLGPNSTKENIREDMTAWLVDVERVLIELEKLVPL